jgi:hypothetical protein
LDRLPWFVVFFSCGLLFDVLSYGFVLLVCQVWYLVACLVELFLVQCIGRFCWFCRGLISSVRKQSGWLVACLIDWLVVLVSLMALYQILALT